MLVYYTIFSFVQAFVSLGFTGKVFNETVLTISLKFYDGHSRKIVVNIMNDHNTTKVIIFKKN